MFIYQHNKNTALLFHPQEATPDDAGLVLRVRDKNGSDMDRYH